MPLIMTAAFWCDKEEIVVKLFDNAYGFIRRRGDFQFVVINEGGMRKRSRHTAKEQNNKRGGIDLIKMMLTMEKMEGASVSWLQRQQTNIRIGLFSELMEETF